MDLFADRSCQEVQGDPIADEKADQWLEQIPGWQRDGNKLERAFEFKDHYEAMAFVHAVAYISHAENHHPEMVVGYNSVVIRYTTHSVGGLSENDFICAAKVNRLL